LSCHPVRRQKRAAEFPRLSSNREASNRVDRNHSRSRSSGSRKVTLALLRYQIVKLGANCRAHRIYPSSEYLLSQAEISIISNELIRYALLSEQCLRCRARTALMLDLCTDSQNLRFEQTDSLLQFLNAEQTQILPRKRRQRLSAALARLQIVRIHGLLLLLRFPASCFGCQFAGPKLDLQAKLAPPERAGEY